MISRRALIVGAPSLALPAALLSGCGGSTGLPSNTVVGQISSTVLSGLQAIAATITSVAPQLVAAGLPSSALGTVNGYIQDIEQVVAGVNSASSAATGATVLSDVETYINTIAPIILPFVSAIPGGSIIGLIVAALPAIETALGTFISLLTPAAKQVATTAPTLPASARFGGALTPPADVYLYMLERAAAAKASRRLRRK